MSTAAAHTVANTVSQGSGAASAFAAVPARSRPVVEHAVRAGFTHGLDVVFLVGALLSFVAAVLTLVLIRSKDFEASSARGGGGPAPAAGARPGSSGPEPSAEAEPEGEAQPTPEVETTPDSASPGVAFRTQAGPPAAAAPAPAATVDPSAAAHAEELRRSAQVLIDAAEQAVQDYARHIDREAGRHREAAISDARSEADRLMARALERSDAYAASLRLRLDELSGERDRLVDQLRAELDSAVRYADDAQDTRAELYRVIGELGRAPLQLARDDGANGNGAAQPERQSSGPRA